MAGLVSAVAISVANPSLAFGAECDFGVGTTISSTCQIPASGFDVPAGNSIAVTAVNAVETLTVSGSLTNSGTISGASTAVGVLNGTTLSGRITNYSGATISGTNYGIDVEGRLTNSSVAINNAGTISGGSLAAIAVGQTYSGAITGSISNSGLIQGASGISIGALGTLSGISPSTNVINNILSGTISGSDSGILIAGSVSGVINNMGSISGGASGIDLASTGTLTGSIQNSGTISFEGDSGPTSAINIARLLTGGITNSGTVEAVGLYGSYAYGINIASTGSVVGGITNSGTVSGTTAVNIAGGTISGGLLNTVGGVITGSGNGSQGVRVVGTGLSGGINNEGTITAVNSIGGALTGVGLQIGNGVAATTVSGTVTNSGTISGETAISISANSTVNELLNLGSIISPSQPAIQNSGTITTLVNSQGAGNASGALTYTGNLPTTYKIYIASPASYGQLSAQSVSGSMIFGVASGSIVANTTYRAVLRGIASSNISNSSINGRYGGYTYRLVLESGSSDIWDLIFGGSTLSTTNTLSSIQINTNGLATTFNQQAAVYQAALSYDCQRYDTNNLCVSVGSRYTYAGPSPSANQQAGLVILGYKPISTFRMGAFADQSVNNTAPSGIAQSKTSPMWGLFAKWHMNKDETGLGVQASAVSSASKLTTTRAQLTDTEPGSGSTQFNGQGYQLTTNYHQPVTGNTSLVPYIGLRYTRINSGAYTENAAVTVTAPLSYNAMAQNTFSAIGGVGVRSHLAEKLIGTASVGIQQNLKYSMGNYAGTSSISGLESFSVQMPGNVNSMATASAGLYYDVRRNERIGLNVLWQQQPFIATNTTTALATYTIGF